MCDWLGVVSYGFGVADELVAAELVECALGCAADEP